jgi:4-aminobutyrate aminotransferase-like enzyme
MGTATWTSWAAQAWSTSDTIILLVIRCGMRRNVIRFRAPLVTTDARMVEVLAIPGEALTAANA